MADLAPGAIVAGYRIDALVGRGGMGVVYRATQLRLERVVALKVIAPDLLDDQGVRERFLAEASAAASVDHANVIPVYDADEADGIAYIAMRYVAGEDLRSLVRFGGPLDPAQAADIVAQAGAALDAIHRAGFVHRDVKPANLLLDAERHVYVDRLRAGQGGAHAHGRDTHGQWVGTLDYVAPEQVRGGRIDARADVYALGGVLHFALTGRVPFERDGDEAKLWAQLSAPPPVPSTQRRGLRGAFDDVVARAMAKAPEERYPSAGDLGRAANAAVHGRRPSEPERMVARGAAAPGEARSEPGLAGEASTRTSPAPASRRRRWPILAAVASAVAILAGALVALTGDDPSTRAASPTPSASPSPSATAAAPVARAAATIENVGSRPSGIAYAGGDLWVTSPPSPFLTRIVAATGVERADHPRIGRDSTAIVGYEDSVWVTVGADRLLLQLDARTGKERTRTELTAEPRWLSVDPRGVWVGTRSAAGMPGLVLRFAHTGGATAPDDRHGRRRGRDGVEPGCAVDRQARHEHAHAARPGRRAARRRRLRARPRALDALRRRRAVARARRPGHDRPLRDGRPPAGHRRAPGTTRRGRSSRATSCSWRVATTSRCWCWIPETMRQVTDQIPVGLNPIALAASDGSVWVTAFDNTVTRIDHR